MSFKPGILTLCPTLPAATVVGRAALGHPARCNEHADSRSAAKTPQTTTARWTNLEPGTQPGLCHLMARTEDEQPEGSCWR